MPRIVDSAGNPPRAPKGESPPKAPPNTPPKAPTADASLTPAPLTPDERKLATSIATTYQMVGGAVVGLGFQFKDPGLQGTGIRVMEMSQETALAWVALSRKNATVKAWLKRITEASAAGAVVSMHVTMLIPLLASRGVLPGAMVDVPTDTDPTANGNGLA